MACPELAYAPPKEAATGEGGRAGGGRGGLPQRKRGGKPGGGGVGVSVSLPTLSAGRVAVSPALPARRTDGKSGGGA